MSNAEKRSVSTDALETLGTLIGEGCGRDAIHLAVEPVEAAEVLHPGQNIGLVDGKATAYAPKKLGIVDPFLKLPVYPGQRFWLIVYPRQITSLRHVWTHPDFPEAGSVSVQLSAKEVSEAWLHDFVQNADCPDYHTVIAAALNGGDNNWDDEYLHFSGSDAHGDIPPEFWDHVEVVTGQRITRRPAHFSCSC